MVAQNKEGAPPGSSTAMLQRHRRHKGKSDHEMSGGTACSRSTYCECSLTPSGDVAHAHPACRSDAIIATPRKSQVMNSLLRHRTSPHPPSSGQFLVLLSGSCCCVAMSTTTGQHEGLHCCCCPTDGKVRTVYSVTQADTLEAGLALGHLSTKRIPHHVSIHKAIAVT